MCEITNPSILTEMKLVSSRGLVLDYPLRFDRMESICRAARSRATHLNPVSRRVIQKAVSRSATADCHRKTARTGRRRTATTTTSPGRPATASALRKPHRSSFESSFESLADCCLMAPDYESLKMGRLISGYMR